MIPNEYDEIVNRVNEGNGTAAQRLQSVKEKVINKENFDQAKEARQQSGDPSSMNLNKTGG